MDRKGERLVMIVEMVAAGRPCFPPGASRLVPRQATTPGSGIEARLARLSRRECGILALTVRGFTSREIGGEFSMTAKSVDNARGRIRNKLEMRRRSDLVAFAMESGLLDVGMDPSPPG